MTTPAWYAKWRAWRYAGKPKGKRPKDAPRFIPLWAWMRLAEESQKPKPIKPPVSPYGTKQDAGLFSGRGIMLGSNPDVWGQALELAKAHQLEVVAATPVTYLRVLNLFNGHATVVIWCPPEVKEGAHITQAESQNEWNHMGNSLGVCANSWTYGRFDNKVALVECYYNEAWGVDFGIFKNYTSQGAKAVIPVCGGYHANGRSDAESARLYQSLGTLPFPGFWMYAGESLLTQESVEVLKAWP